MSKYKNKKTIIDGITFDSKREATRYQELKWFEQSGKITHLTLQPKFELLPKFRSNRAINYIADFSYCEEANAGKLVVEDVKGMQTTEFKIKKKLFEYKYPELELRLIK